MRRLVLAWLLLVVGLGDPTNDHLIQSKLVEHLKRERSCNLKMISCPMKCEMSHIAVGDEEREAGKFQVEKFEVGKYRAQLKKCH